MDIESKTKVVNEAKDLSPFFQVEVTIRVLGHVIWHFVFPPKNKS